MVHQHIEDAVLCGTPVGICYRKYRKDGETAGAEQNWVKFAKTHFFFFVLHILKSHVGGVKSESSIFNRYDNTTFRHPMHLN